MPTTVVWFRQDLRIVDNPALAAAAERGSVVPLYIHDDEGAGEWPLGGAARWWLQRSLEALDAELRAQGSRLIVRGGAALAVLERVVAEVEADGVVWNRCYEPRAIERDQAIKRHLKARGLEVASFNGSLLFEPWQVATQNGDPYKVYTPFARACLKMPRPAAPAPAPPALRSPRVLSTISADFPEILPPAADWTRGLQKAWSPGLSTANKSLAEFVEIKVEAYGDKRDRPDLAGTSRLSPRLHWGELSPRQVWHAVLTACGGDEALDPGRGSEVFLKELIWREFGYHILYHFPHLPDAPLKRQFRRFPWADDKDHRNTWRFGRTGYPIVDAGMRQLRTTGWMHNRVRMIVGSFLVKDLLEDWRVGARWFWDNLVDADLASNTLGWQWVGGCGPDAAPYFRIFNPVTQGQKFDPQGAYVRRWVPEIGELSDDHLQAPWQAPKEVLARAGVVLGQTYPHPIVDHKQARARALDALERIKQSA